MKLLTTKEIIEVFGKCTPKLVQFCDSMVNDFLMNLSRDYSLDSERDRKFLWKRFNDTVGKHVDAELLKEIFCISAYGLATILADNMELFNRRTKSDNLKSGLAKKRKEFEEWLDQQKADNCWFPLEDYNEDDDYDEDEERGRAFIIYYAYDPADTEVAKVFRVKGKTSSKAVQHMINMYKMAWNYETRLGYYHANPCTVDYYRKTGKDELIQHFMDA